MTRWVVDNRARRVPNFVIEATGLDTKKKIEARYGTGVVFEKGKRLPPVKQSGAAGVRRSARARRGAKAATARATT